MNTTVKIAIVAALAVAFASLVFGGELAPHLSTGIGVMLFGCVAVGTVVALTSSFPGSIGILQEGPLVILAVAASAIATSMSETPGPDGRLMTVIAVMAVTSAATGAVLLLLGWFQLGNLMRFIPYPVIGGFLAGTGLVLVLGAIGVIIDQPLSWSLLRDLPSSAEGGKLAVGLGFGGLLFVVHRRCQHFLALPLCIVAPVLLFFLVNQAMGSSLAQAQAHGWLFGALPEGMLWDPSMWLRIQGVDWSHVS